MTPRLAAGLVALALALTPPRPAVAHVGSPDAWFEGHAGPYPVRVVVRAPGVIPGLAEIGVRLLDGTPRHVTVQSFAWDAGPNGAPAPDEAKPVPGDAGLYAVPLWFMTASSYAVHVAVDGDRGAGTAIVPVQAVATRRLPMDAPLTWILLALGAFLFAGLVTIAGAAVRDASLGADALPDARRRRRALIVMAASAAVLALGLAGGRAWWNGVDHAYAASLYRPFHAVASVATAAEGAAIRLTIDDPRWRGREWTPLITDHGKLMHLFLVRDDLGAMAHLHPAPRDSERFEARLPPLPAGRYRVYADIVHESGFAQTLTASVELAAPPTAHDAPAPSDPDDSWCVAPADASPTLQRAALGDGATLDWQRGGGPLVAGREQPLRFRVTTADGAPAGLEPYLGMIAHAVATRADGAVYAHLHPTGTAAMASTMALTMRTPADSLRGSLGRRIARADAMGAHGPAVDAAADTFTIPYGFPRAGRYRVWVQVRRHGVVRTAVFDADVLSGASPG